MKTQPILLKISRKLNFLSPYIVKDLIRLGNKNDGGYVIPQLLIKETDFLVSLGISNDWSFDEDFKKINPAIHIHGYDHTISARVFRRNIRYVILNMFLLRFSWKKLKDSISLLFSYQSFFKDDVTHFQKRIHNRQDYLDDITLDDVILKTKSKKIFLKIDIEGSEYRIIDSIVKHANKISGIAIEFHETDPYRPIFISAIKKLQKKFKIVHFHPNNFGGYSADGLPETPEITFINNKINIKTYGKRKLLPLDHLDAPNGPLRTDYQINFNL
ncbi:MAG: hypothetical protein RL621_266 [Bacteroidota bacterium]|jgi:hypothetical protein